MIILPHLTFPPKVRDIISVGTDLLFDAIFPIDAVGPDFLDSTSWVDQW